MPHSQTYHFIVANKVSWAAFGFTQFSNTARRDAFQHALCQVSSLKFFSRYDAQALLRTQRQDFWVVGPACGHNRGLFKESHVSNS